MNSENTQSFDEYHNFYTSILSSGEHILTSFINAVKIINSQVLDRLFDDEPEIDEYINEIVRVIQVKAPEIENHIDRLNFNFQ